VTDFLLTQVFPRAHLPGLFLLGELRALQRQLDACADNPARVKLLETAPLPSGPPIAKDAVYLQRDSLGRLWAAAGRKATLVCADRDIIDNLNVRLAAALAENKTRIRAATKDGQDNREFWGERKTADAEISDIVEEFSKQVLGSFEFPAGDLSLALPTDLLAFPIEAVSQLRGRRVTRLVPLLPRAGGGAGAAAVLNPSGDLQATEDALRAVLPADCSVSGGKPGLEEAAFLEILGRAKHFIYAGHCGGERLWNGTAIQRKKKIPASIFLLGCRSAEPYGSQLSPFLTPFHYLVGGAPCVTGVLWDVLGRDCDRISCALVSAAVAGNEEAAAALVAARQTCKLKTLTAAAFVVYCPINN